MLDVLLVDDDREFTEIAANIIEFLGHNIQVAADLAEAKEWLASQSFDHILLDFMLPDGSGLHLLDHLKTIHANAYITFITGHPSVKGMLSEVCGPKVDYLVKPLQREDIESALNRKPAAKKANKTSTKLHFDCLIGESAAMQELYLMIERVAGTQANVMLMGESGVGKEVVASAIHRMSQAEGKLIATNCGALSNELISSELFGHEKGAFTGAVAQKIGVFERAENGTLFLDEVTEMPLDMQPNLLRVLESKKVVRVGGTKEIAVNCRVVSATNRSLESIAQDKVLREDIYFRLAVFPITIPALRERKEDIPLLANAFLDELNQENDKHFSWNKAQLERLCDYDWPGNVRELRHCVHRTFIMSDPNSNELRLPSSFASPFSLAGKNEEQNNVSAGQTIEDVEKNLIRVTLEKVDGNKTAAAEMLGISTKTLYNRLHAYGELTK
ncbi:sigma-54 dependent transcriptional regulator [Paraglaciecola aquimarina]|uniref:Sigma-54 dependent transcriptional regulator n=1 Tax=Paraglaciecola aquimarina TaxID=1235557 RepID=A0ABU3SSN4_9ALTE|nr:sigma-54 dependent transcriptional regulator [Paraglaciecola aquimarina]MDU0353001.1 sigma-54 dependent transcriptional regulator [Paraglaciecola aquimarina]